MQASTIVRVGLFRDAIAAATDADGNIDFKVHDAALFGIHSGAELPFGELLEFVALAIRRSPGWGTRGGTHWGSIQSANVALRIWHNRGLITVVSRPC